MSKIVKVSKFKDIYVGEVVGLQYNEFLKINGVTIQGSSFQTKEAPMIELFFRTETPFQYIHKETGNIITAEEYKNSTDKYSYHSRPKYGETFLEKLEYSVTKRQLKLPQFVHSAGEEVGDLHNPLVSYYPREVIFSAITRTLIKDGFTEVDTSHKKSPKTFYCYSFDNDFSIYVVLASGSEVSFGEKIGKRHMKSGQLTDIEIEVEELYLKTERMVRVKTSEKDMSFNHIFRILNQLERIRSTLNEIEPMKRSESKYRQTKSLINDFLQKLTDANLEDITEMKRQAQEEQKLRQEKE